MTLSIYDTIFLVQLAVLVGVFLAKLYNVLSVGKFYNYRIAIVLFVTSLLAAGLGLLVMILEATQVTDVYSLLFVITFSLETLLFLAILSLSIVELFLYVKEGFVGKFSRTEARKSLNMR